MEGKIMVERNMSDQKRPRETEQKFLSMHGISDYIEDTPVER